MKIMVLIFLFGVLLVCPVQHTFCAEEAADSVVDKKLSRDLAKETEDVDHGFVDPDKTKMEKVSDSISTFPEKTGNKFLNGFHRFGDWLEEKSGQRFETKWNTERHDNPSVTPEQHGYDRDPAMGS